MQKGILPKQIIKIFFMKLIEKEVKSNKNEQKGKLCLATSNGSSK